MKETITEMIRRIVKEEAANLKGNWTRAGQRMINFIFKMQSGEKIMLEELSDKFSGVSRVEFKVILGELETNGHIKMIGPVTSANSTIRKI